MPEGEIGVNYYDAVTYKTDHEKTSFRDYYDSR